MKALELITMILGIPIAMLGIVGGLLSLPGSIRTLRKQLRPHGAKGVGFCVLSREDSNEATIFTILVVEDLFHFLGSIAKPETGAQIKSVDQVGDYYKVVLALPPGKDYYLIKRKKNV